MQPERRGLTAPSRERTVHYRDIPFVVAGSVLATDAGFLYGFPDENATNRVNVMIPLPARWYSGTDITVTTIWFADATGLADLEDIIEYVTETDETTATSVQALTNNNLTWAAANRYKKLTTTITAENIDRGRYFRVGYRRNTGDANTGTVSLARVRVVTGVDF
jgi:hypothetical protein